MLRVPSVFPPYTRPFSSATTQGVCLLLSATVISRFGAEPKRGLTLFGAAGNSMKLSRLQRVSPLSG